MNPVAMLTGEDSGVIEMFPESFQIPDGVTAVYPEKSKSEMNSSYAARLVMLCLFFSVCFSSLFLKL